jgi:hypothetical protein
MLLPAVRSSVEAPSWPLYSGMPMPLRSIVCAWTRSSRSLISQFLYAGRRMDWPSQFPPSRSWT